jgi:hypothetical protein
VVVRHQRGRVEYLAPFSAPLTTSERCAGLHAGQMTHCVRKQRDNLQHHKPYRLWFTVCRSIGSENWRYFNKANETPSTSSEPAVVTK